MLKRYSREAMFAIWTELSKKTRWYLVELAALFARQQLRQIPEGVWESARTVEITSEILARADELEATLDHDLIAFILSVNEKVADMVKPHLHDGLTSYCTEDSATATQLVDSVVLLIDGVKKLIRVLLQRADEHRNTLMVFRTHHIHGEPGTLGYKLLNWVDTLERHLKRLEALKEEVGVIKMSGATGTYVLDPAVEKLAAEHLGLKPARISTQILSRDIIVNYINVLVGVANSLDKFAIDIRLLAGTDIGEVAEFKKPGAKGSSAMPGKSRLRNPIKSENVCSLAKVMRGLQTMALQVEGVWNERSLDNSAAERIFLPDASICLDFMIHRFIGVMEKLEVYPQQMLNNLNRTGGIIFAQRVMMALTEKGMHRDQAYNLVEELALAVQPGVLLTADYRNFKQLVEADGRVSSLLSPEELAPCFDPKQSLRYIDQVFARFGL